MKSLNNALKVLEYIVSREGQPVTPSAAGEACGMNVSSCVRILHTLVEHGYIKQISSRVGYVPGPLVVTMSNRENIYSKLAEASTEPLNKLSEQIGNLVNVSVMHQDKRFVIKSVNRYSNAHIGGKCFYSEDNLETATGRLLMSMMSKAELSKAIQKNGISLSYWHGITTSDELYNELAELRQKGWTSFWCDRRNQWIIGSLINVAGYPPAAIGFGVTNEAEKAVSYSNEAAARISANLTNSPNFNY